MEHALIALAEYDGDFKQNTFNGYGRTVYSNGDIFEGYVTGGRPHGHGMMRYLNGDRYDGEWVHGVVSGMGTFFYRHGQVYEGEFKANKRHGQGIMQDSERNTLFRGMWHEGDLIHKLL